MSNLESITIHQFRGLRDLELKDLGRINLLVGINNSGKTSVLEALEIYCHPLDIRAWLSTALQREQESRLTRPIDAIEWLFTRDSYHPNQELKKANIFISSSGLYSVKGLRATYEKMEGILLSDTKKNQEIDSDDVSGIKKGIDLRIEVDQIDHLTLFNHQYTSIEEYKLWEDEFLSRPSRKRDPKLHTSVVTPSSHRSEINKFRDLSEATLQNFKPDVIQLLKYIDHNISDIEILLSPESISSRFNIYIQHEKLGLAPVSTFGDGIRRLLHIALKLASVKGGILLIDELESTIHTEALQSSFGWLVKWCTEMDVQLFATTHSLEAVDALLEVTESDSDLVLYRLEPKEEKTRVVRHDGNRLRRLREELGQEVRW